MSATLALVRGYLGAAEQPWLTPDPLQRARKCPGCGWYVQGRECDREHNCELPRLVRRGLAPKSVSVHTRSRVVVEAAERWAGRL